MFEKDYIMRQVQQMVQALSKVLGLKEENKYDKALDEIGNSYTRFFNENRETIQSKNLNELIRICTQKGRFSPDLAIALADLIKEEAEILEQKGETGEAVRKHELALGLYQHALAEKEASVPIDAMQKMEILKEKIEEMRKGD